MNFDTPECLKINNSWNLEVFFPETGPYLVNWSPSNRPLHVQGINIVLIQKGWLIYWLNHYLFWLIGDGWLIWFTWLIDWLDQLTWLIDSINGFGYWIVYLFACFTNRFGSLIDWLSYWLFTWFINLINWLIGLLIDWWMDGRKDRLMDEKMDGLRI